MHFRNIVLVLLLATFPLFLLDCSSSSESGDATTEGNNTTTAGEFPDELNLNVSDNLKGSGGSPSLITGLFTEIGSTTEYYNEITTAFATTFGDQGDASISRMEDLADMFNSTEFTTGNNCVSSGDADYRCLITENVTFETTTYDKVARCYLSEERYLEWFYNNDGSTSNNGVLISQMTISEDHGGPEEVGDTLKARLNYNLDDPDAKSVAHYESISRDSDLVSTIITTGLENESTETISLEALFYGDYSGDGAPTTNHDVAKHDTGTDYTYIAGISYNNHIEAPGDDDEAECIDDGNLVIADTNCTGLEVTIASDSEIGADYDQDVDSVDDVSLAFSDDFEETIPSDLETTTCTDAEGSGSEEDSPSEETITSCLSSSGIASTQTTMDEITEEAFSVFCLCVIEEENMDMTESECTTVYDSCDSADTLEACVSS